MYFLNSTYTQIDTVVLNSLTVHCLNYDHNYAVVNPNWSLIAPSTNLRLNSLYRIGSFSVIE